MAVMYHISGSVHGKVGGWYARRGKGSLGQNTTIWNQTNYSPKNPRTYTQMEQRARFANAVKFYKHATQNFFKFAFEDKKSNESDYNAFMRHNIKNSCIIDKTLVDNALFPALGDKWQLARGSLGFDYAPDVTDDGEKFYLEFYGTGGTVATWSKYLISNTAMKLGDIVTLVFVVSPFTSTNFNQDEGSFYTPLWQIAQFKLSLSDNTDVRNIQRVGSDLTTWSGDSADEGFLDVVLKQPQLACWYSVIVTRKSSGKLLATNSFLEPNNVAKSLVSAVKESDTVNSAVVSWGATSSAILQGGVADGSTLVADTADYSNVTLTSVNGSAVPLTNVSLTGNSLSVVVVGTNLPSDLPTSSNVGVAQVEGFEHESDTQVSFNLVQGGTAGSFYIVYAGKVILRGTVSGTSDVGSQQGSGDNTSNP